MSITVKVIVIVSYLQAHKLAYYSFMDAGRGQRLLGQRQKEFITNGTMSILSYMFAFVPLDLQLPCATWRGLGGCCAYSKFTSYPENSDLRKPKSCIMDLKKNCLIFASGETSSLVYCIVNSLAICSSVGLYKQPSKKSPNNGYQCLHGPDIQKQKRPMGNYIPTDRRLFTFSLS